MNIRFLQKSSGETVLQKYTDVGTNQFGHVIFGWVDVETVLECELPMDEMPGYTQYTAYRP